MKESILSNWNSRAIGEFIISAIISCDLTLLSSSLNALVTDNFTPVDHGSWFTVPGISHNETATRKWKKYVLPK